MKKNLLSILTIEEVALNISSIIKDKRIMNNFYMLDCQKPQVERLMSEEVTYILAKPNNDYIDFENIKQWLSSSSEAKQLAIYQLILVAIKQQVNLRDKLEQGKKVDNNLEPRMSIDEFIQKELDAGRPNPFPGFLPEENEGLKR